MSADFGLCEEQLHGFEEGHAPDYDEEVGGIARWRRDAKRSRLPVFEFGSLAKPQRSQRNPLIPGGYLRGDGTIRRCVDPPKTRKSTQAEASCLP